MVKDHGDQGDDGNGNGNGDDAETELTIVLPAHLYSRLVAYLESEGKGENLESSTEDAVVAALELYLDEKS